MQVRRCKEGHWHLGVDCAYCQKIQKQNEEFERVLDDISVDGN